MKIPTSFNLLGYTIAVQYDPSLDFNDNATGMAHYRTKRIRLQPSSSSHPVHPLDEERTFIHEVLHQCLHYMERNDLCEDEKFVNLLAGMIHQAITTAKFEEDV